MTFYAHSKEGSPKEQWEPLFSPNCPALSGEDCPKCAPTPVAPFTGAWIETAPSARNRARKIVATNKPPSLSAGGF